MSYLSEAYQFLVPNYYFHTNNNYMVIADDYQVEKLHAEKINEPRIECTMTNSKCVGNYIRVSPTITNNDFPQLPNMFAKDDLYRQRGRGWNEPVYLPNNQKIGYCNPYGSCNNYRKESFLKKEKVCYK